MQGQKTAARAIRQDGMVSDAARKPAETIRSFLLSFRFLSRAAIGSVFVLSLAACSAVDSVSQLEGSSSASNAETGSVASTRADNSKSRYKLGKPYTIRGKTYYPKEDPNYSEVGMASWYGSKFHGGKTANGEIYDMMSISAAHKTLPMPSYVRVTNLRNDRSIIVRINNRGPFVPGRLIDVSRRTAELLDFARYGVAKVKVEYVGPARDESPDHRELAVTLTTDGSPAALHDAPTVQMVSTPAEAAPETAPETAPEAAPLPADMPFPKERPAELLESMQVADATFAPPPQATTSLAYATVPAGEPAR